MEKGNRATMAALARARAQIVSPPPDSWVAEHGQPILFGDGTPDRTWCSKCHETVRLVKMRLGTGTWDVHFYCAECDKWPTVMVCRPCHQHWHKLMDRA